MSPDTLMNLLRNWLKYECHVDPYGHIFPSKTAIDIAHFYFIESTKFTKTIEDAKMDRQGGILVSFQKGGEKNKYILHIMMDGTIDYYTKSSGGKSTKQRLSFNDGNKKGFGTDKYHF